MTSNRIISGKYRLALEVKTRVFIDKGSELIVGEDIILSGDKAYLISIDSLIKRILGQHMNQSQFGLLLNQLLQGRTSGSGGIISFLMNKYGIKPEEVSSRIIRIADRRVFGQKMVKQNILINGHYCVPGTTIKGVLRTALLYWAVKHSDRIEDSIDEAIDNLAKGYLKEKNVGWKVEKLLKQIVAIHVSKRKVIEQYYDVFKNIQVTDPLKINEKTVLDTMVVAGRRNPFKNITSTIPVIALDEGARMEYEMTIYSKPRISSPYHEGIKKLYDKTIRNIFDAMKEFSLALIDFERRLFQQYTLQAAEEYMEALKKWRDEVEKNNGVYYVKVGMGGGLHSKTVYLALSRALRNKLESVMSRLVSQRTRGRIRIWDHESVKLVGSEHLRRKLIPFAWAKIELRREPLEENP